MPVLTLGSGFDGFSSLVAQYYGGQDPKSFLSQDSLGSAFFGFFDVPNLTVVSNSDGQVILGGGGYYAVMSTAAFTPSANGRSAANFSEYAYYSSGVVTSVQIYQGGSVTGGVLSGATSLGTIALGTGQYMLSVGTHSVELDGPSMVTTLADALATLYPDIGGAQLNLTAAKYFDNGALVSSLSLPNSPLQSAIETYGSVLNASWSAISGTLRAIYISPTKVVVQNMALPGYYTVFSGTGLSCLSADQFDYADLQGTVSQVQFYTAGSYNSATHSMTGSPAGSMTFGSGQVSFSVGSYQVDLNGASMSTDWRSWALGEGNPSGVSGMTLLKDGVQVAAISVSNSEIDVSVSGYKIAYAGSFGVSRTYPSHLLGGYVSSMTVTKLSDASTVFSISGWDKQTALLDDDIVESIFDTVTALDASALSGAVSEGVLSSSLGGLSINGFRLSSTPWISSMTGGAGSDTLTVEGARSSYRLVKNGDTTTLTDVTHAKSIAMTAIENIAFTDQTVATSGITGQTFTGVAGGHNNFTGGATDDTFNMQTSAGNDVLSGGDGGDYFNFAGNFTVNDQIDGGAGIDALNLDGDYFGAGYTPFVFGSTTMTNVDVINLGAGHGYNLTLDEATTPTTGLSILGADSGWVVVTTTAETDPNVTVTVVGGTGVDQVYANKCAINFAGGAADDIFWGATGAFNQSSFDGGTGLDTIRYGTARSAFTVYQYGSGAADVIKPGGGVDHLASVERIVFSDQIMTLGNAPAPDFNCDGHGDIVWQSASGRILVMQMTDPVLGSGGGVGPDLGPTWHVMGTGDVNGDGYSDILLQNDSGQARIWFIRGLRIYTDAMIGSNPGPSWHIKGSADFDGSGKTDILWQNDNGQVGIWLMNSTTVTSSPALVPNPGPSWHVIGAGDFDGDGKADILWQNDSGQAGIWFMNGTTVRSMTAPGPNPGSSWHLIGTGDFNNDLKADMLWQNDNGHAGIWLMNGTTILSAPDLGVNPDPTWKIKSSVDFDGDGKSDILGQNASGNASVWHMDGTNVISILQSPGWGASWGVANNGHVTTARTRNDFDDDGHGDLLWQNDSGQLGIWLLNGTAITTAVDVGGNPGPAWHTKGSGDFDGDGRADVLWQNDSGQAGIWQMFGTTIQSAVDVGPNPGPTWKVIGSGDFDGDGKADILWQSTSGQAGIWFMNGTTPLSLTTTGSNPGPTWHVIGSGDFNGDGKADILWQSDSGQAGIWLMNGTTILSSPTIGSNPGPTWHVKGAGDFDGNGKSDILWQSDAGQAGIWFMDGTTVLSQTTAGNNPGSAWQVKGAADVNGDGKSDILWQNINGQAGVWLMNGNTPLSQLDLGNNPGSAWHLASGPG